MIVAKFQSKENQLVSVKIQGHAGYGNWGEDIVCASVSSAVQMLVNGLVEVLKLDCKVDKKDGNILLEIRQENKEPQLSAGFAFMEAFCLNLKLISQEYSNSISVIISEVL